MPACNNNCLLIRQPIGNFPPPPVLVRSVHATCLNCNRSVSEYGHRVCYECAQPNNPEFDYHHYRCRVNAQAPMTPIAPDNDN